ncbi:MAG: histidine phosphatase family protein [Sediminibacterium sp. Gen4]|jgi:phosphohistidine phosphatase|uniref:SixA phosphatase family protein n=1 Tax=unclassified Sediminibacterium TaxID=2635961 RepID=UPI0015C0366C|nr:MULTISPECIES: histidine phosphatase family protein [unclassified Sediminibacterium]MBW0159925.1 histidine phosphatase family protein [Sediminibacterium sp.]MBW0165117.1 histidine phosphatase family protein [Sediminibacterium sp.]NWK64571.1 histidine phosphatase family protein [Sediminibacterium sp. Gen4]
MKELLVIRHAKSSWANAFQGDFERPLNDRGHRDAPAMAERMMKRGVGIQCFASSTANRALTTAVYFAEAYGKNKKDILLFPELYHAPEEIFYQVITKLPDNSNTVALFSHNPGITDFINSLTNTRIDNMPTCGIFAIKTEIKEWRSFRDGEKEFWFFDYPKNDL